MKITQRRRVRREGKRREGKSEGKRREGKSEGKKPKSTVRSDFATGAQRGMRQ